MKSITLIRKFLLLTGVAVLCILVFIVVVFIVAKARPDPFRRDWSNSVAKACNRQYIIKGRASAFNKIRDDKEELRQVVRILFGDSGDQYIRISACGRLAEIDPDYEDFIIPYVKWSVEDKISPNMIPYETILPALIKRKTDQGLKFIMDVLGDKESDHFLHKKRGQSGWTICEEYIIKPLESATRQKTGHDHEKWIEWFSKNNNQKK